MALGHVLISAMLWLSPHPADTIPAPETTVAADTLPVKDAGGTDPGMAWDTGPAPFYPDETRIPAGPGVTRQGVVRALWGERAPDPSVHLGLWAFHLERPDWGVTQHSLVGATWRGYFGGTFVNTYGNRSYAAGVRRIVAGGEGPRSRINLGYRLGLITGYDERLIPLAGRLPAIPALEVIGGGRIGPLGIHWSWAGVVTQLGTVWYWPRR